MVTKVDSLATHFIWGDNWTDGIVIQARRTIFHKLAWNVKKRLEFLNEIGNILSLKKP